jgi:predicted metal-dependent hydrolase
MISKQPYNFSGPSEVQKGVAWLGKKAEGKFNKEAKKAAAVKKTNEGIRMKAAVKVLAAEDARIAKQKQQKAASAAKKRAEKKAQQTPKPPTGSKLVRQKVAQGPMKKKGY